MNPKLLASILPAQTTHYQRQNLFSKGLRCHRPGLAAKIAENLHAM